MSKKVNLFDTLPDADNLDVKGIENHMNSLINNLLDNPSLNNNEPKEYTVYLESNEGDVVTYKCKTTSTREAVKIAMEEYSSDVYEGKDYIPIQTTLSNSVLDEISVNINKPNCDITNKEEDNE